MSGPSAAVAAVRVAVRRALTSLPSGAHVLVACSGGPDSLALAAATAFVAPRAGLTAGAAVVDHGWHPASASVAAAAATTCERLGLAPVAVLDVAEAAAAGRGGPEAAARDARYAALEHEADAQGAVAVLLGHTLDDQAETVLLGLARGSGARSLAGMPARRGRLLRPLLGVARVTTRAACADLGLEPHDDPANADPAYARVRVRGALAQLAEALGPGLPAALARTAEQLALDAEALEAYAAQLLQSAGREGGYDLAVLAAAPDAVRRRALLAAARDAGSPGAALGSRHVLALDGLVVGSAGRPGRSGQHGGVHLPGGFVAVRRCGTLSIAAPGNGPIEATD
jgi:tRNA(Ile)-lysidine synthetase-like protein